MGTSAHDILGRDDELGELRAFVTRDEPRSMVIEGEAGIGKTTLWRAATDEARAHGVSVLSCSPAGAESRLSFAALSDLFTERLDEIAPHLPDPQRRALQVALLLAEPSSGFGGQRTVAAATLSFLRELARNGDVLVAIDDVQWLDEPSEASLSFAFRRLDDLPVRVLVARRTGEVRPAAAGIDQALSARGDGSVGRLRLGAVSEAAIDPMIRDRLGLSFPRWLCVRIHAISGGNPFYALEVARALAVRSEPLRPDGTLPVPESLHELVQQRIEAQLPRVGDLLAAVAALRDPTLSILADAGFSDDEVDEAVGAGLLDVMPGGRLQATHPLLASSAYDRLGPMARLALHERLVAVVDGEERAWQLALAASEPSEAVAAEIHDAGHRAAARGAISTAADLLGRSIELTPPERIDRLVERRIEAAGYEVRRGVDERATAYLLPLVDELPPGTARVRALLGLVRLQDEMTDSMALCRQALESMPAGEPGLAAEAQRLTAEVLMLGGDVSGALDRARVAAELAEQAGDAALLVESLGTVCHYETYMGSITPGLIERAIDLERRQPRPSNNYSPREIWGLRLMYSDRLSEARDLLVASLAAADEMGDEVDRAVVLTHLTQLECRAGRLATADRYARESAIAVNQTMMSRSMACFVTALAGAHLGRVEEARAAGEDGAGDAAAEGNQVFRVLNLWALGFLDLSLGDAATASGRLRALPEELAAMGYRNPGVRPVYADAIEARIGAGDLEVEQDIDELEGRGRELDYPWARATAARCRGLLQAARGDLDAAVAASERALAEHETCPQPLERGRTLLVLGSTLRRARRWGAARERLTESLELFDDLGAALWAERAAAELARVPGRARADGGLSETERRVAELAARGASNKEIAGALFVSVRTVEANLSKVYTKLGVRSRAELASLLSREPGT